MRLLIARSLRPLQPERPRRPCWSWATFSVGKQSIGLRRRLTANRRNGTWADIAAGPAEGPADTPPIVLIDNLWRPVAITYMRPEHDEVRQMGTASDSTLADPEQLIAALQTSHA